MSEEELRDLREPGLYVNRELSWLAFNQRVLDQAHDGRWPLLERLKFLAITCSNLDEFFMIRVSGLHEQLDAGVSLHEADGLELKEKLRQIGELATGQLAAATELFLGELSGRLAEQRIVVRKFAELTEAESDWAREYFRSCVFPVLTPLGVDPVHPFPFLSNLSLSLAVEVAEPDAKETRFARVKVPESLKRFIPMPEVVPPSGIRGDGATGPGLMQFLLLEDIIANCVGDLFPGLEVKSAHAFRVTRDMDLDILEDKAEDLLKEVDRQVRHRRFGAAVRLEIEPELPSKIRQLLLEKLEIEDVDVYESRGPLGLACLFQLASLDRPELRDPPLTQRVPGVWSSRPDPFAAIRAGDILLHHPYDSFSPVLELLGAAASDPNVLAIKMTLYRAGADAEAVRALVRAADNGKQVAVSIELKARFDEANNIAWARALERVGAHVFYGASGLKTHAKALLIVRREGGELRRYVHLSTGNYNPATARLYTDTGLMTCDPAIGEDVSELFNSLSGYSTRPPYRKLSVAPFALRKRIGALIGEQVRRAQNGGRGRIFAKLNAVVDSDIIHSLYEASRAGVSIDLVVRGICCLRPGVPGVSENIRVRSMVGRFLEHERIFVFGAPGEEEYFLSSADWMPRNLDRRVEVFFPVTSEAVRRQIFEECIEPLGRPECAIYEMAADGSYGKHQPVAANAVDPQDYALEVASARRVRTLGGIDDARARASLS